SRTSGCASRNVFSRAGRTYVLTAGAAPMKSSPTLPERRSCSALRASRTWASARCAYGRSVSPASVRVMPRGPRTKSWTARSAPSSARSTMTTNLVDTALLPPGFRVPASRWTDPATRLRELLDSEPFVFAPGVFDPHGAELAMYHGARAVYFSGYSFAIGHLGTTDMDLYSGPEIADAARRTVSALRKFQLTMALGDPEKEVAPRHLAIPPVVV